MGTYFVQISSLRCLIFCTEINCKLSRMNSYTYTFCCQVIFSHGNTKDIANLNSQRIQTYIKLIAKAILRQVQQVYFFIGHKSNKKYIKKQDSTCFNGPPGIHKINSTARIIR